MATSDSRRSACAPSVLGPLVTAFVVEARRASPVPPHRPPGCRRTSSRALPAATPCNSARDAMMPPSGKPTRDALGEQDDIGRDAEGLGRERAARASHAALHLVEHEERADVGRTGRAPLATNRPAERRSRPRRAPARRSTAPTDVVQHASSRLERAVDVVDASWQYGACIDAGQQRLVALAVRRLRGRQRRRRQRSPVERTVEGDHAGPAGDLARQLQRTVDRLGPRVAEEHLRLLEERTQARRAARRARSGARDGSRPTCAAASVPAPRWRRRHAGGSGRCSSPRCPRRDRGSGDRPRRSATTLRHGARRCRSTREARARPRRRSERATQRWRRRRRCSTAVMIRPADGCRSAPSAAGRSDRRRPS